MSLISRPTEDLADFPHAARDVVLLDRVAHRDVDVLEALAQSQAVVVVALGCDVYYPLHT